MPLFNEVMNGKKNNKKMNEGVPGFDWKPIVQLKRLSIHIVGIMDARGLILYVLFNSIRGLKMRSCCICRKGRKEGWRNSVSVFITLMVKKLLLFDVAGCSQLIKMQLLYMHRVIGFHLVKTPFYVLKENLMKDIMSLLLTWIVSCSPVLKATVYKQLSLQGAGDNSG